MLDLHLHSTASDGTSTPAELAEKGRDFSIMALTDHDNCAGVEEFLSACGKIWGNNRRNAGEGIISHRGQIRLAGIELSVFPGAGYERFHLLGLGIDPSSLQLNDFLKKILAGRNERNAEILRRFAGIGISIPMDELLAYTDGDILARPHFAAWLSDHGYASGRKEAFEKYLTPESPSHTNCYVTRYHPDPGEAFDVIHAAGGVCVMAHPRYWTKDPKLLRAGLRELKTRGLDGIEAVYQANSTEETVDHLRAAKELDLCVTAGSDFHGINKPTVTLGMEVSDERDFIGDFLKCISRRRDGFSAATSVPRRV